MGKRSRFSVVPWASLKKSSEKDILAQRPSGQITLLFKRRWSKREKASSISQCLPGIPSIGAEYNFRWQEKSHVEALRVLRIDKQGDQVSPVELPAVLPRCPAIVRGPQVLPRQTIQCAACSVDHQARWWSRHWQMRQLRDLCASLEPAIDALIGTTKNQAWLRARGHYVLYISSYSRNVVPVAPIISTLEKPLVSSQQKVIGISRVGEQ